MEVKRILFPLIALAVPAGVLFGFYLKSENDLMRDYNKAVEEAKAAGVPITLEDLQNSLPPDADNAAIALLEAFRVTDFKKLQRVAGAAHIKESESLAAELDKAAAKPHLVLKPESAAKLKAQTEQVGKVLNAAVMRAMYQLSIGDRVGATRTLKAAVKVRDLLMECPNVDLAVQATEMTHKMNTLALQMGAQFGTEGVRDAKPLVATKPIDYSVKKVIEFQGPVLLALADEIAKDKSKPSPLHKREELIKFKAEVLKTTIHGSSDAKERVPAADLDSRTRRAFFQSPSRAVQHIMYTHSVSTASLVIFPFESPPADLLPWYWAACEQGGKPADIGKARDRDRNPIRYVPSGGGGFIIRSTGPNHIDEGGSGDDRWISYISRAASFKN